MIKINKQLTKIKFLTLVDEILEYIRRINRGLELSHFGLDQESMREIKNLPLIIELGKKVYRENLEYGVWDSYGYKHHVHGKNLEECLTYLNPLAERMLKDMKDDSPEEIIKSINETNDIPKTSEIFEEISDNSVFVVHGRDETNRAAMFEFLEAIGLNPIEWEEAIKMAGKPNPHIDEILIEAYNNAQAILVMFTPDDEARLKKEYHKEEDPDYEKRLMGQARPNVLFEAGMAYGRDPDRTVLIQIGQVRKFSDISGRHLLNFDGTLETRENLADRLTLAGCSIDKNGDDWTTAGAFKIGSASGHEVALIEDNPEKAKIQQLFDELTRLFIRLYSSKAGTSMLFARTIRDSTDMQKYFGISVKESAPPGKDFDDLPIYFVDKRFQLVPNSATLRHDKDRNGTYLKILNKNSPPDRKKEKLYDLFRCLIDFVQREFKVRLDFNGEISIQ
ncbi:MAG: TIR domain-containing protein [Promethearchaeota archaeon]